MLKCVYANLVPSGQLYKGLFKYLLNLVCFSYLIYTKITPNSNPKIFSLKCVNFELSFFILRKRIFLFDEKYDYKMYEKNLRSSKINACKRGL